MKLGGPFVITKDPQRSRLRGNAIQVTRSQRVPLRPVSAFFCQWHTNLPGGVPFIILTKILKSLLLFGLCTCHCYFRLLHSLKKKLVKNYKL